jgi:hypothetical protein
MVIKSVEDFINAYAAGTLGNRTKIGNWSVYWWGGYEVLEYTCEEQNYYLREGETRTVIKEVIAYRNPESEVMLVNANRLERAGGNSHLSEIGNDGFSTFQRTLIESGGIPIPFTIFKESNLDVRDFTCIVKPLSETVQVNEASWEHGERITSKVPRHFVGVSLFKVGDHTFLFDIDRQEIKDGVFNPFIVHLPNEVSTVREAYDALMPDEVKKAIDHNLDVKRQGELFFIWYSHDMPSPGKLSKDEEKILKYVPSRFGFGISEEDNWHDHDLIIPTTEKEKEYDIAIKKYNEIFFKAKSMKPGALKYIRNTRHRAAKYIFVNNVEYVNGWIEHSSGEHKSTVLNEGWYKVVRNAAITSWAIHGNID